MYYKRIIVLGYPLCELMQSVQHPYYKWRKGPDTLLSVEVFNVYRLIFLFQRLIASKTF